MLDYFLILFLSHLLTDFVFQSDAMVACKYGAGKKARMALFYHAGTYFITSLFLFFCNSRDAVVLLAQFNYYYAAVAKPLYCGSTQS